MNAIKYFLSITLLLAVVTGCKKETFDDTSFVNSVSEPAKISVLFDITQDNTGSVTITPNGEGVTTFDVYYGDGTETFVKVAAGKNVQHKLLVMVFPAKPPRLPRRLLYHLKRRKILKLPLLQTAWPLLLARQHNTKPCSMCIMVTKLRPTRSLMTRF
jgi:hypothetical protein